MRYIIDIDGTICKTEGLNYKESIPCPERIEYFNTLFDQGENEIIYCTGRGALSGEDFGELTENQIKGWGVKYHRLSFNKEPGDCYIDDKAKNAGLLFNEPRYISKTNKIWGVEFLIAINSNYVVKMLKINPNFNISKQYHEKKHETWYVMDGTGEAVVSGKRFRISPGDNVVISPGTVHQVKAVGGKLIILETSTPELEDIIRIQAEFEEEPCTAEM